MSSTSTLTSRPLSQHVVQAAVADVVGPAVAADDPDALRDQVVGERVEARAPRAPVERLPAAAGGAATRSRCARDARPRRAGPASSSRLSRRSSPSCAGQPAQERRAPGAAWLSTARRKPEPELGVVLEQRVGPGRPAAVAVGSVGRGGQVAAVDRRAAGGVGDQRPVAEQLGQQLDVGGLAAAGAGARVLEQRLEELRCP